MPHLTEILGAGVLGWMARRYGPFFWSAVMTKSELMAKAEAMVQAAEAANARAAALIQENAALRTQVAQLQADGELVPVGEALDQATAAINSIAVRPAPAPPSEDVPANVPAQVPDATAG